MFILHLRLYAHTHTHSQFHLFLLRFVCVCVCVWCGVSIFCVPVAACDIRPNGFYLSRKNNCQQQQQPSEREKNKPSDEETKRPIHHDIKKRIQNRPSDKNMQQRIVDAFVCAICTYKTTLIDSNSQ